LAPSWQIPLLQEFFIIAFIILSPFVGSFSDAWPKGLVLLVSNGVKFFGSLAMLLGLHPLLAYMLVGIGASLYSPAKYGILSELVSAEKLVMANGLLEGTTVVAVLLGAVLGGKLVDTSITATLIIICLCYLFAAGANMLIPRIPVRHNLKKISFTILVKDFWVAITLLFRNNDSCFSLIGTSIFWGTASTLRMLIVAWVPLALGITDLSMPANLNGAVAIGIAVGAVLASFFVSLKSVNRVLPAGILIGIIIIVFANVINLYIAILLMVIAGALGGFYLIPLNALLQERGNESVGSGHAVAIQSFVENCVIFAFVGLYTLMNKAGMPIIQSVTIFGGTIFLVIILLAMFRMNSNANSVR
jgi:LPLT family lysophospholipid transporter-like MFS transporter